ncbi:pol-like protein [Apostichopus japonicus]|uniref:Pol-like protein n=1 Tax=Stichopus japonicus TaxID=307972 RepID=A0A2G8KBN0_STIJA|nr:pol-like protein [Apostichopus japonicus]
MYLRLWRTLKAGFVSVAEWWETIKSRIRDLCIVYGVRRAREKRKVLKELQSRCLSGDNEVVARILAEEREGAFIRSRERFLEDGETPGYFYLKERARAQAKFIKQVRDSNGCIVKGTGVINVFHEFYSHLYSADNSVDRESQSSLLNSIACSVSADQLKDLEKPIELSEIKLALSAMAKNKSPGIDGLPAEFYLEFLDLLGEDLLCLYNDVFCRKLLSVSQRISVVTLLPKKGDALDPANRRPISLLTADYKVIAKILQLRLSRVMSSIVSIFQTCSVPGRSIHQNLSILRDIADMVKFWGNACAFISLDQHKAFDKILYTDIRSKVLVNGQLSDDVTIQRGVRQGCPLSPALYVLFIEPLAQYILQCNNIRGFHIPGSGGRVIKLLQYADDARVLPHHRVTL